MRKKYFLESILSLLLIFFVFSDSEAQKRKKNKNEVFEEAKRVVSESVLKKGRV